MRILFVHEIDWIKKVALDMHYLAEILSSAGHQVYAIDYADTWSKSNFSDLGTLRTIKVDNVKRIIPEANISLRRPGYIKIPVLSRVSASVTHYFEIRKLIREEKIDLIMLYSVPTNGLQVIHLAHQYKIPVVFRSIDILHQLVKYKILQLPTKQMERFVYSKADAILAITPNHVRYVTWLGAPKSKVQLLPLPVDTSVFHPNIDPSEIKHKWGFTENDRIILFIGTLFNFSGLDGFIQEFPHILDIVPNTKLLIVGDGPQHQKLDRIISQHGLNSKITITGFQPYSMLPQYINAADICINPFSDSPTTRDIFPGKIIQYMACGAAVVATPLLGIKSLVNDETQGNVYTDGAVSMAREVINLLQSPERREKLGNAAVNYVKQTHSEKKIAQQLNEQLESIVRTTSFR